MKQLDARPPVVHHLFNSRFFRGDWRPDLQISGARVTRHASSLMAADFVMVHLPSMLSTNPASALVALRAAVPKRQIWVGESLESAANYPQLDDPDFMGLFDLEASYRRTADIFMPYIPHELGSSPVRISWLPRRPYACAFISSPWDGSGRRDYVRELVQHMRVDSYGRFMRNRKLWVDRGVPTKMRVLSRYRFTLAFENSVAQDYVTEKFFQPLMAGSIPVYLGAPNVGDFAPGERCFVNAAEFEDPAELARFLREIDPADYHAWRRRPLRPEFEALRDRARVPVPERLAAALAGLRRREA